MQIEDHWCGGKAELEADSPVVRCSACKIYGEVMDTPELAIIEWNRHMIEVRQLHLREELCRT